MTEITPAAPMKWYRLDENMQIVECPDGQSEHESWARWAPGSMVLRQDFRYRVRISTCFHGCAIDGDESHPLGPLLFETLVMPTGKRRGGATRTLTDWLGFQMRYRRAEHALNGHEYLMQAMRGNHASGVAWHSLRECLDTWEATLLASCSESDADTQPKPFTPETDG